MAEEVNPDLEQFRRQWQEEVIARNRSSNSRNQEAKKSKPETATVPISSSEKQSQMLAFSDTRNHDGVREDHSGGFNFDDMDERAEARRLGASSGGLYSESHRSKEPVSALEHYERAVERESQGQLGESLVHYRKAYKLDDCVDQVYKNKHFPPSSFKYSKTPSTSQPSASTSGNLAHPSLHGPLISKSTIPELLASFSTAQICATPPIIEGIPSSACPLASIPSELLVEIFFCTASLDVASFARASQVCKRFAYLVASEDWIWRQICYGAKYGFGAMHYSYSCNVQGAPLPEDDTFNDIADISTLTITKPTIPDPHLPLTNDFPSYRVMFRHRPRIRFSGVYISTVNYVRPGASAPSQVTWNSPVHVVTYYRYLRFYRDGTCISLLTTTEPLDVVPYLSTDNLGTISTTLPVSVMKNALRGRWRLSRPSHSESKDDEPEGNLYVETMGPTKNYTYSMQLSFRSNSGTKGPRNTKLVWRGFWSYNHLTDDWAEFALRNYRAFVWSRVKSWVDA